MGCDIHMYAEIKQEGNEHWSTIGRMFKNDYYDEDRPQTIDEDGYGWNDKYELHPYDNRNYDLFAILANVRNGTWSEPLPYISKPKGLPKDVSKYVKKEAERWKGDGHSHSYLTLDEIREYDWDYMIQREAAVTQKQKDEYEKNGTLPQSYAAMSSSGVRMSWDEPLRDTQRHFLEDVLPQIEALEKWGEVRLVFWFDN